MDGFGASLTDSFGAAALQQARRRDSARIYWQRLFDPVHGIGLNFLREPTGASDFAAGRLQLRRFAGGRKRSGSWRIFRSRTIRPTSSRCSQEALAVNPHLKIIATPMERAGMDESVRRADRRGRLKPEAYPAFAKSYFCEVCAGLRSRRAFPFSPSHRCRTSRCTSRSDYPGMGMSWAGEQQAAFYAITSGPAFRAAHLKTKVMIFDHNWNRIRISHHQCCPTPRRAASSAERHRHALLRRNPGSAGRIAQPLPRQANLVDGKCPGGEWQTRGESSENRPA